MLQTGLSAVGGLSLNQIHQLQAASGGSVSPAVLEDGVEEVVFLPSVRCLAVDGEESHGSPEGCGDCLLHPSNVLLIDPRI